MPAKLILPSLSAFTLYAIWYYAEANGLLGLAKASIARHTVPGSNAPLRTVYTGLPQLDELLTTLTTFFWPTTDGSHPALTLHTLGFAGTFGSAWILITLESWRHGNAWTVAAFPLIFGLSAQTLTFAFAAPLYCALQLSVSPTAKSPTPDTIRIPRPVLRAFPWVFAISFIVPSGLMILPVSDTITTDLKQIFIALWQPFPAYISLLLTLVHVGGPPLNRPDGTGRKDLRALRFVYAFAFAHTAINHLVSWTISLTTVFAPTVIAVPFREQLHPSLVFGIPTPWTSPVLQVTSVAEGVHAFLRWDCLIGSAGMVVWASALYVAAHRAVLGCVGWGRLLVKVVLLGLVAGPVGAAVELVWERDELVLSEMGGVRRVAGEKK
ncbi:hypothetical protein BO70DRAFT_333206 [Aspergillus heteromorphus CBS 117.55]|uniref:AtmA protein n=1 Tax=Aspergillus heteromorphus CBS 117.55 TaxID=1448321 RepID=A0A317WKA3_9EURO|nr:uncharacterized protein BO70DRAFT_333206 [Aspergillus heteromorphus CBS 117.55]PWY86769.1 hypothetical protein BO70DRAFT_333206 [Aspergillus heteromorphus CBS 117.55]